MPTGAPRRPRPWLPFLLFGLAFLGAFLAPYEVKDPRLGVSQAHFKGFSVVSLDEEVAFGVAPWLVRHARSWLALDATTGDLISPEDPRLVEVEESYGQWAANVTWHWSGAALGVACAAAAFLAFGSGFWWNWIRAWGLGGEGRLVGVVIPLALWPAVIGWSLAWWVLKKGDVGLPVGFALIPPELALGGSCYFAALLITLVLAVHWRRQGTPEGWREPEDLGGASASASRAPSPARGTPLRAETSGARPG